MKKSILITALLVCTLTLISSQKIESETEFLKQVIVQQRDSIIYIKESWGWEKMKEKLNRKKFRDYNLNNNNSIELSDTEYNYIINEINTNKNHVWDSNLIKNSESVNQNDVESYLKKKNLPAKLEFEEQLKLNDTSAVVELKNKTYFAYSFSKPIFFRKGKFCIFSYNMVTGDNSSNYKQVAFYKKVRGKWIVWLEIYNSLN